MKLNYEFSIRDIDATKERHIPRIKKLKQNKEVLNKMIEQLEENNLSEIWQSQQFRGYSYAYNQLKQFHINKTQKILKSLKSAINYITYQHITYLLEYYDLPKSYATSFYCIYYTRINRLMKRNIKEM